MIHARSAIGNAHPAVLESDDVTTHAEITPAPASVLAQEASPTLEPTPTIINSDVLALVNAIAAGHVRPTVVNIRRHLQCSGPGGALAARRARCA